MFKHNARRQSFRVCQRGRSSRGRYAVWLACAVLISSAGTVSAATEKSVRKKMGSRFEITAVHADRQRASDAIGAAYAEIDRLEALISSWNPESQTSELARTAGTVPARVHDDLFGLIRRSLKVAKLTDGAFDISFAGAGRLWNFKADPPRLPDDAQLKQALRLVDYRKIAVDVDSRTVLLEEAGMRIGFGGIGKGFAANRAAAVMREMGITSGVVNAGGDLLAFGEQENGDLWTVSIADPKNPGEVFARLGISNQAVVTSGDYESFFEIDGKRYAHILDPRTGYPVSELASVTIVCPDAELADALATAVSVLGPKEGMALVNRLQGVEALLVSMDGDMTFSHNLESNLTQEAGSASLSASPLKSHSPRRGEDRYR